MTLAKKVVLVTGGSGQLGEIVVETFSRANAQVAASYLSGTRYAEDSSKRGIVAFRADVTREEEVATLFGEVKKKYGSIDILVNLVGGFVPKTNFEDTSLKDWDRMMNMNLKSTFLCCREFLKSKKDSTYGRIINLAAMTALYPSAGRAPYAASKAGVVVLTKTLGEELKSTGITANAIAPSIIRTKANMESMPGENFEKWVAPEEIAKTMLFLCSDNAKSINGLTIPMFGGV